MLLRLDTLLLSGTSDIAYYMVEGNLSAAEFVRLAMCCKGLRIFMLSTPGLLYLPVHRSLPCITGLAIGMKSSYYLSIVKRYFGEKLFVPDRLAAIRYIGKYVLEMGSVSVEERVDVCIFHMRDSFCSAEGRTIFKWCLEQLHECVEFEKADVGTEYFANQKAVLHSLSITVDLAFCVTRCYITAGIANRGAPYPMKLKYGHYFKLSDDESGDEFAV
jgi:hypothetical protein